MYDQVSFDVKGESEVALIGSATMPYEAQNRACELDDNLAPEAECVDQGVEVPPFTDGYVLKAWMRVQAASWKRTTGKRAAVDAAQQAEPCTVTSWIYSLRC